MNKKVSYTAAFVLLMLALMTILCSCNRKSDAAETTQPAENDTFVGKTEHDASPEPDVVTVAKLSDEQALSAIKNYCCTINPGLGNIVKSEEYPVYWEIDSSDEHEIVVLFRSYTGAQNRFYIDRTTGDTYVTEYAPGITSEEQRTDESFHISDFFDRIPENKPNMETEEFISGFFNVMNEEPFFDHREDGMHYGFEMDFWEGCSTWCAVTDYRVTATASSSLTAQGEFSYEPSNIYSANRSNAWIEGAEGYGIGEFIEISRCYHVGDKEYGVDFRELCIVNGYAQTLEKWTANSRVEDLKLFFNGEYIDTFHLEDTIEPQYFDLKQYNLRADSGAESVFRFEIASVYPGEKFADTAITGIEIDFWTPNH